MDTTICFELNFARNSYKFLLVLKSKLSLICNNLTCSDNRWRGRPHRFFFLHKEVLKMKHIIYYFPVPFLSLSD